MEPWRTFGRTTERILEWTVAALMAALTLDVIWQVATRYLLRNPSSWTDELATLLMIWVALLGASLGFLRRSHLGVDYFVEKLSLRDRKWAAVASGILTFAFASGVLIYGGIQLVALTWLTGQVSPALGVKMGHVYLALPVSGVFVAFASAAEAIENGLALANPNAEAEE